MIKNGRPYTNENGYVDADLTNNSKDSPTSIGGEMNCK